MATVGTDDQTVRIFGPHLSETLVLASVGIGRPRHFPENDPIRTKKLEVVEKYSIGGSKQLLEFAIDGTHRSTSK